MIYHITFSKELSSSHSTQTLIEMAVSALYKLVPVLRLNFYILKRKAQRFTFDPFLQLHPKIEKDQRQ